MFATLDDAPILPPVAVVIYRQSPRGGRRYLEGSTSPSMPATVTARKKASVRKKTAGRRRAVARAPRGASLPDPSRLFNSSLEGNTRRAIDIHQGEPVDARAFKALVKAAVAKNGAPAKKR